MLVHVSGGLSRQRRRSGLGCLADVAQLLCRRHPCRRIVIAEHFNEAWDGARTGRKPVPERQESHHQQ